MTMAYRHANMHSDMAAKYTQLGHLEEMLHTLNQAGHFSIILKIGGHETAFVSGRDASFDAAIKAALEKQVSEQLRLICNQVNL